MLGKISKALQYLGLAGFLLCFAWQWQLGTQLKAYPLVADPEHGYIFQEHAGKSGPDYFVPASVESLWRYSTYGFEASIVAVFLGIGLANYKKNRPQNPN
jgi:ABC-type nitrate/sulfonate/bicarbonate transport system permease component